MEIQRLIGRSLRAIIDLEKHFNVDRMQLFSAGKNTPFHGWELNGLVTHTLFNGQVVYQTSTAS